MHAVEFRKCLTRSGEFKKCGLEKHAFPAPSVLQDAFPAACATNREVQLTNELKDEACANDYAAIAAVGSPLVEEVRPRRHSRVRRAEIASIGGVEEVSAELQLPIFTDTHVLKYTEVEVVDAVGTQDVTT